jgi:hypothetical protein
MAPMTLAIWIFFFKAKAWLRAIELSASGAGGPANLSFAERGEFGVTKGELDGKKDFSPRRHPGRPSGRRPPSGKEVPGSAPICLTIHRHYGSETDEIAYLVVEVDHQETRRRIRSDGEAALRHIGYRFAPRPGADVYDVMPYTDRLSAHETVRALARFRHLP